MAFYLYQLAYSKEAIKAMVAYRHGAALWARTRPPLVGLSPAELADLKDRLTAIGASVKDLAA